MTENDGVPPTVFDMDEIGCLMVALASMPTAVMQASRGWTPQIWGAVTKALHLTIISPAGPDGRTTILLGPYTVIPSHRQNPTQNGSN
ncbi:hypothetical protein AB0P21_10060 [Kribbella sp. NPDC056861]|uniref:hypothetical protein n=1 Tax=Kribbella sp. NPDC056861 TaxID=3154857 RepID=UPI0034405B60